jgi:hypothetical protein
MKSKKFGEVEVIETLGTLSHIRLPNGAEFWVKSITLMPLPKKRTIEPNFYYADAYPREGLVFKCVI